MTKTRPTGRDNFGPSWPEVESTVIDGANHIAGFGEAPQQAVFRILAAGQNLKNMQVWPHLPCLPFSGIFKMVRSKNNLFIYPVQ